MTGWRISLHHARNATDKFAVHFAGMVRDLSLKAGGGGNTVALSKQNTTIDCAECTKKILEKNIPEITRNGPSRLCNVVLWHLSDLLIFLFN